MTQTQYDVLVIGSGAAGLGLALCLADQFNVAILCKDNLQTSASQRAQGGIAAVMSQADSIDSHIQDTLLAGAGLCDPTTVEFTVTNAKNAIEKLIAYGIEFTTTHNGKTKAFHLTREGGHSHRRILHAEDKTGAVVVKTLLEQVKDHPNIHCFTEMTALSLLIDDNHCQGVQVLNNDTDTLSHFYASKVVLATGGASMTYLHTTNPGHTSGDGIALAFQAGARIANLEFTQFHPTCLYNPEGEAILITESMRGEGAKLILPDGTPFMHLYDPRRELAPRDIVSRAIDHELKIKNLPHVLLDISFESPEKVKRLFPNIYSKCLQLGIDITRTPIPVVPAAHYTCGGVVTNLRGETDVKGLFAIGEVACTGLHGANRMASNSLLECLVFAESAAATIRLQLESETRKPLPSPTDQPTTQSKQKASPETIATLRTALQTLMWNHVGIVRSNTLLQQAALAIQPIEEKCHFLSTNTRITKDLAELKSMLQNTALSIHSARHRQESRGTHYNVDYPGFMTFAHNTLLTPTPNDTVVTFSEKIHTLVHHD